MVLMCLGLHESLPEKKKQIATGLLNCSLATASLSIWHTWLQSDMEVKLLFFSHDLACKRNVGSTASSTHKGRAPLATILRKAGGSLKKCFSIALHLLGKGLSISMSFPSVLQHNVIISTKG